MSNLIDELKEEHVKILALFSSIEDTYQFSKDSIKLLLESKILLLNHLAKEDEFLYPLLQEKAKLDFNLKITLDIYAKEMKNISAFIQNFYNKYTLETDLTKTHYRQDVIELLVTLQGRIMKEEVALFMEYEEISSANPQL